MLVLFTKILLYYDHEVLAGIAKAATSDQEYFCCAVTHEDKYAVLCVEINPTRKLELLSGQVDARSVIMNQDEDASWYIGHPQHFSDVGSEFEIKCLANYPNEIPKNYLPTRGLRFNDPN